MSKKPFSLAVILVAVAAASVHAAPVFSLSVTPGIELPLGPGDPYVAGAVPYTLGFGAELAGDLRFPFAPFLFLRGEAGYSLLPVLDPGASATPDLSLFSFGAGVGASVTVLGRLQLSAAAGGGYYLGVVGSTSGGNLFVKGQAAVDWILSPSLKLGAGAEYRYCLSSPSTDPSVPNHLYDGLGVRLGMSYTLGSSTTKSSIQFIDVKILPVFPVFYKYYDTNPIGSVTLRNTDVVAVRNVKVSFYVKEYMDQPKLCVTIPVLRAGETREIPLYALFKDSILTITEGTKAGGEIRIDYDSQGVSMKDSQLQSAEFLYRNAMVWDKDEKAAAFVTAKDPDILQFAKRVTGALSATTANAKLTTAAGLYEAMRAWGLKYVVDPASAYSKRSTLAENPDYLQFPVETLLYKGGDCDDLSILYAALLEAVGTPAAFITIPGHIFTAFSLDITQREAESLFADATDLIFVNDTAWIPVEVTALDKGFRQAWKIGAEEWRKASTQGTAAMHPVEDAWATYQPVARPADMKKLDIPAGLRLTGNALAEITAIAQEQVTEWEKRLKGTESANRLGIVYARYGMFTKAMTLLAPLADKGNAASQVNLANIYYIQEKYDQALGYYQKAAKAPAANISALIGIARTQSKLRNNAAVTVALQELRKVSPENADRFQGLDGAKGETARAAAAADSDKVLWQE